MESLASGIQKWQNHQVQPKQSIPISVGFLLVLAVAQCFAPPVPGTRLSFRVLSAQVETAPPFAAVDFTYGPEEPINRRSHGARSDGQWWQLEIRTSAEAGAPPGPSPDQRRAEADQIDACRTSVSLIPRACGTFPTTVSAAESTAPALR